MGFGFSRYYDCCDIPEGYGDGPCGGYYSYREKCRRSHEHDRGKGCCNEYGRDRGCKHSECGHDECREHHEHGHDKCHEHHGFERDRGCFNERGWGRDCCCNPYDFPGGGCFPFGCCPGWNNQRCGLFLNIPFGGCNMGFFMPFNNRFDSFDT